MSNGPLIEFMPGIKHALRAIAIILPMLALCSVCPPVLAVGTGVPAPWVGTNLYGKKCQGTRIPYGPYDYLQRQRLQSQLFIVEEYHLSPQILRLEQGTTTSAIKEIQYTLMAWPNHHKALYAAYQYRLIHRGDWLQNVNSATPVECHLQRAIKFSPKDPVPYMILGLLMHDFEQYKLALKSFRTANRLLPNDVITQYNMGLTLVELGQYDEAAQLVEEIYRTDFPLQGLKNKLARATQQNAESAETLSGESTEDPTEVTAEAVQEEKSEPLTSVQSASVSADDKGVDSTIVRE